MATVAATGTEAVAPAMVRPVAVATAGTRSIRSAHAAPIARGAPVATDLRAAVAIMVANPIAVGIDIARAAVMVCARAAPPAIADSVPVSVDETFAGTKTRRTRSRRRQTGSAIVRRRALVDSTRPRPLRYVGIRNRQRLARKAA